MAPIAALLLEKGLTLLGNAVLAKGEKVIEDKLGVKLTPEEINQYTVDLKKLEFEHEEFLLQTAKDKKDQELAEKKMDLDDVQGARTLGTELSKSASPLNQNIMPVLALLVVVGGFATLWFSQSTEVRMAAVSLMTLVLGYFFGSSHSSRAANDYIRSIKK